MASASDGLVEWRGKAGQVRVGHLIQGSKRTKNDVWEVIETKNPPQIEYAHTLWWRVANLASGYMAAIPPKIITYPMTFMLTPLEFDEAERTKRPPCVLDDQWPIDAQEVLELVAQLGATEIATHDRVTGEITCPAYEMGGRHTPEFSHGIGLLDEIEHLRLAHGLDVSGLQGILDHNERLIAVTREHGVLHSPRAATMAHRGFPHRHIPEEHDTL